MLEKYIKNKVLREIVDWVIAFVFAYIIFLVVRTFIFQNAKVDGTSMEPTLEHGDLVVINRLHYRLNEPEYNDIVAFPYAQDRSKKYIKRIIGMPNDVINIIDNEVYVNDVLVPNEYSDDMTFPQDLNLPATVPEGSYFVLGDNREVSSDSRYLDVGFIKREDLLGQVSFRFWPLDKIGTIKPVAE
jgi:signal peptidase I